MTDEELAQIRQAFSTRARLHAPSTAVLEERIAFLEHENEWLHRDLAAARALIGELDNDRP